MSVEILSDWKFWAFVIAIGGSIINWLATQKVANNHLSHLDVKIDSIAETQKETNKDIKTLAENVAFLRGKDEVNTAIVKILEKALIK